MGRLITLTLPPMEVPPGTWSDQLVGNVAKWLCCPLREATSAALPYTRRAGFLACTESTRPVQPRSTQPPAPSPSPKRNFYRIPRESLYIAVYCCIRGYIVVYCIYLCILFSTVVYRCILLYTAIIVGSVATVSPLRHASNPCGPFSLCASANCCVPGPP